jgi:hypothetical protein
MFMIRLPPTTRNERDGDDAMGMPVQVTLSSSGIGRAINLDWMSGQATAYTVIFSSSGTAAWTVEGSPNDLNQTSSANAIWFSLSSGSANRAIPERCFLWAASGSTARRFPRRRSR